MKKTKLNIFYKIAVLIYILTCVAGLFINFNAGNMNRISMCFVAMITPFLVPLVFKILHWQMNVESKLANIIFVYFASLIGSGFGGYSIPYFDKVLHFTSGLLGTIFGILLFHTLIKKKRVDKKFQPLYLLFINAVNISIAALWEFFEYFMLVVFNNDCINHYTTGVHDSLTDMICAFIAGLILTIMVIRYYSTGKSSFFIRMADDLCDKNI